MIPAKVIIALTVHPIIRPVQVFQGRAGQLGLNCHHCDFGPGQQAHTRRAQSLKTNTPADIEMGTAAVIQAHDVCSSRAASLSAAGQSGAAAPVHHGYARINKDQLPRRPPGASTPANGTTRAAAHPRALPAAPVAARRPHRARYGACSPDPAALFAAHRCPRQSSLALSAQQCDRQIVEHGHDAFAEIDCRRSQGGINAIRGRKAGQVVMNPAVGCGSRL